MFKWFAGMLDGAPDKVLEDLAGPEYAGSVSRLGLVTALFAITLVVAGIAWWSGLRIPQTAYMLLPATQGAKPTPVYSFPLPTYAPGRLQAWTSRALSETLTFNFTNVEQRLNAAGAYYTPAARQSLAQAIEADKIAETVVSNRLAVALTPVSPPFVIKAYRMSSVIGGEPALYWDVEAPVILNYIGASQTEAVRMRIYLRLKQVPTTENPDGLAISGFYARVGGSQ